MFCKRRGEDREGSEQISALSACLLLPPRQPLPLLPLSLVEVESAVLNDNCWLQTKHGPLFLLPHPPPLPLYINVYIFLSMGREFSSFSSSLFDDCLETRRRPISCKWMAWGHEERHKSTGITLVDVPHLHECPAVAKDIIFKSFDEHGFNLRLSGSRYARIFNVLIG